ncbi:MAG: helix-turn-helix domain-containing protein [Clostridia bacterium]|nr:helix-turn-helix domain-containing protein [Clostridia bacterium]
MKNTRLQKGGREAAVIRPAFLRHYFVSRREIQGSKLHSHTFFEFEVILEGEATHLRNGRPVSLRRGSAYLLTPSEHHSIVCREGETLKLLNFSFLATALPKEFAQGVFLSESAFSFDEEGISSLTALLELLHTEERCSHHGDSLYAEALLQALFHFLLRYRKDPAAPMQGEDRIFRVLSYIHENFQNDVTLSELADMSGYSYGYLSQLIRQYTGQSFKHYLIKLRIGYARRMILNTDLGLSEICYASGFGSYSQFAHQFTLATGAGPDAYRKEHRGQTIS